MPVLSAAEASAVDRAAIAGGIPSRALMQRAGAAAAAEIARRFPRRLRRGALVLAGPGNNGGDAWVVARALAAAGVRCIVHEPLPARTPDAIAERALALPWVERADTQADLASRPTPGVVVDGLLGIGSSGAPRGPLADAIAHAAALRTAGARVVALDVPSGMDAATGAAEGALGADLTLTFGAMKRGLLIARATAGAVVVLDIGLPRVDDEDAAPRLVDGAWVRERLPRIAAAAHKGDRKKLVVVGGAPGMAGATVLAARAAARSGVGMVKLLVPPPSVPVVQAAAPEALAAPWPDEGAPVAGVSAAGDRVAAELEGWADVVLAGPGLGRSDGARRLLEAVLERWRGPVVLDADALNAFEGRADDLARLLAGRPAVLTPHPAEFARLAGTTVADALARHFDAPAELAARTGAVVLAKGVPTVLAAPDGRRLVSAAGTPALAAAGSGDLLAGIVATLLAQMDDALDAAACAAWLHGRAAELATGRGGARGVTLRHVLAALPAAIRRAPRDVAYPVLAALGAVR